MTESKQEQAVCAILDQADETSGATRPQFLSQNGLDKEFVGEILASMQDVVFIADLSDKVLFVNEAFTNVYGFSREEIVGSPVTTVCPQWHDVRSHLFETDSREWCGELLNIRRQGDRFPAELRASVVTNDRQQPMAVVVVGNDLSAQKAQEAELQAVRRADEAAKQEMKAMTQHLEKTALWAKELAIEAELANVAKSEFLANMSHEIRTPLNAIIGMSELMAETDLDTDQREYLSLINSSSENLLHLINDILDFSKIEAGLLELESTEFNLQQIVEEATEIFTVQAHARQIELLSFVDPDIPRYIVGDSTRLKQILVNLLGNAIKFTKRGEVSVKVLPQAGEQRCAADNRFKLDIQVSDTGIGISKKNLKRIFEKFSQADSSTTRRFGGTGLGLSISKSLAELMGGKLWAESVEGKGSTFHVELEVPVGQSNRQASNQPNIDFGKLSVLVIDDNPTNRFILRKTLKSRGTHVTEAESAEQALQILNDQPHFDLVICDYQMPDMDGVELVRRIRKDQKYDGLKIIMLSSLGQLSPELRTELRIAQALTKPLRQSQLFDYLQKTLAKKPTTEDATADDKPKGPRNACLQKRILLVEDNKDNQMVAKRFLTKAGYAVDVAENGRHGVAATHEFQYDTILMDIQMPEMDGFEATKAIREWQSKEGHDRTPIIAVTAHAIEGYRERCLEHGLDDYISKPLRKNTLLETVHRWLDPRPTVLVVDDNRDNLKLLQRYVKKIMHCRFVYAHNGLEAVKTFKSRSISLILMDLEMPVMNGFIAVKEIRALPNGSSVPMIALTAHTDQQIIRRSETAGYDGHLTKPLRKQTLLNTLNELLGPPEERGSHSQREM